jgi:hypothetical protein
VAKRLSVGGRFTHYWLEESRRSGENGFDNGNLSGNFLGSLWGIDAQQHYFPNPYIEYQVLSGLGVGVMYDELRVRTLDWANEEHTVTAGDGDLEVRGVGVYLLARYNNPTRYAPYLTFGYGWYKSHFFVTEAWAAAGRRFLVEDTQGWFVSGGCSVTLAKHIAVDVSARYSHLADVQARAQLVGNRYRTGAFPMRYTALTLGVAYAF